METYLVRIRGTKPLLCHSPEGMISDRPRLRRGEHLDPKVEAEMGLYRDKGGTAVIPAYMVKACIREAGRNYKVSGRKSTFAAMIRAAIRVEPELIPIVPQKWVVDVRPVVVQRQRIPRARPRFDEWSLEFRITNLDPTVVHADTLKRILVDAGRYCGLGDYRPEFGLFEVEEFKKLEEKGA
jgi:hypothetical protein